MITASRPLHTGRLVLTPSDPQRTIALEPLADKLRGIGFVGADLAWPPRRLRNWRSILATTGLYRLRRPVGQCPEGPGRDLCSHQVGVHGHCTSIARGPQRTTATLPILRQGADRMARSNTKLAARPSPGTALPPLRNNRPGLALELAPARRLRSQLRPGGGSVSRRRRAATDLVERATRPRRRRLAPFLRAGLMRI